MAATILSIHSSSTSLDDQCARISLTMLFGVPLLIGAAYASELTPRFRWLFHTAALISMAGVFCILPAGMYIGAEWFAFRMLVLMAFALASITPGLIREGALNWWRVNVGWLNSLVLAAIMTVVVEIGLQLALFSVKKLFGLEAQHGTLMSHLHGDLFAVAGLLIFPVAALLLFPSAKGDLDADQPGYKVWGNLCKWALIPIGFLFMGILAAYAVKILIQWKLPNGMVATPVLSLGAYGMLAMLLIIPWREGRPWARWFVLIYPPAFLLSSVLLFISLAVRIREYGITFDRYSALAAGIWLTASAFCFLIRLRQAPVVILFLLAITALIATMGPISGAKLSLRSQSERLQHLLESKNRNEGQVRSIVRLIVQDFGLTDLEKVTGALGLDPKIAKWQLTEAVLLKLNIAKPESDNNTYDMPSGVFIPVEGCTAYLTAPQGGWNGSTPCLLGKNEAGEEMMLKTNGAEEMKLILNAGGREVASQKINDLDFDGARKNKTPLLFPLMGEGRVFLVLITRAHWNRSGKPRKVYTIDYQVFSKRPELSKDVNGEPSSSTSAP